MLFENILRDKGERVSSAFKLGGKREGSCEDPDKQIREQWRCVLCVRAQVCVYGSESVWDLTPQGQCIGSGIAMGFLDLLIGSDEAREQIQPCAPVCVCMCKSVLASKWKGITSHLLL